MGTANKKGFFIVIDGTDGAGKGTQTEILVERLRAEGHDVEVADFPNYDCNSSALVQNYLNGKYGKAEEVGPYRASIFYACDRYDFSFKIKEWLSVGKIVVSNRYVSANMGHQGGKITDKQERIKYLNWLYDLEYNIFGIPKPDINIILHVTPEISQKLVDKKGERRYIGGAKRDIHEADKKHLQDAEQTYLYLCDKYDDFDLIECVKDGEIMTRDEIHDLVWQRVYQLLV